MADARRPPCPAVNRSEGWRQVELGHRKQGYIVCTPLFVTVKFKPCDIKNRA